VKIIKLEAEAFKRLKAVEIVPKGNIVQISGRNAQGKTSCLDALYAALGGASQIPGEPIRKGQSKARIKLDMGEIVVTRSFTKSGTTLTVEDAEGCPKKSPQKILDDLFGVVAMDPLAFSRMKPRDQFDALKNLAKIDLDLDKLDALNKKDYDARTAANREAKELRAQAGAILVPEDPGPVSDAADLMGAIDQAKEEKATIESANHNRETLERVIQEKKDLFARKRQELVDIKADLEAHISTLEGLSGPESTAPLDEEIIGLQTKIANITTLTQAKTQRDLAVQRKADAEAQAASKEKQSEDLTAAMEARSKTKQDAIAAAQMPIPDLGFGDGVVLYKGVPFDQASSAEQLKVSTSIAMAMNPKLRVIRITDGSLLDEDSMEMLRQMAEEHDFQIFLEIVDSSGKVGIFIEDGEVKADNQEGPLAAG
jgi:hypothetical protein